MKTVIRFLLAALLALTGLMPLSLAAQAATTPVPTDQGAYVPIAPVRVLDTRPGYSALVAPGAKLSAAAPLTLQVAGRADLSAVPANASAVVMNVTATGPTLPGFVAVTPTGAQASVSNLNFTQGQTIPNLVTVQVGSGGNVDITVGGFPGVTTDVIADVQGYYVGGSLATTAQAAGTFVPLSPVRLYDTRKTSGPTEATGGNPVPPSTPLTLTVAGLQGVPADASAAVLNVTVTDPDGPGFASVRPGDASGAPAVSNLNFLPGQTIPNLVTVPLAGGRVQYFSNVGTHVVVDLAGYYAGGDATVKGAFKAITPTRIADSRDPGQPGVPTLPAGEPNFLPIAGGNPALPADGIEAVVLNMTATDSAAPGYVSVYPANLSSPPNASNLNYLAHQTIPNLTIPRVASDGAISAFSSQNVNLIADVSGYFIGPGWHFAPSSAPVNAPSSVSCTSATFCAVANDLGSVSLYNGSTWSTPVATVNGSSLVTVSCASSTFCVVTNGSSSSTFDGTSWTAPISTGENGGRISCPSTTFCMLADTDSGSVAYATFNGTAWTSVTPVSGQLPSDVSCSSATFCMGVWGTTLRTWDGASWSAAMSPSSATAITALSCPTNGRCLIVGTASSTPDAVVYDYIAANATPLAGPDDSGDPNSITTVSCTPGSGLCAMADSTGVFIPTKGAIQQPGITQLLSCPTTTFCMGFESNGTAHPGTYS